MQLPEFVGLDIGNHSIKVAQVKWGGKVPALAAIGSAPTPFGVIGSESEDHQKQLASQIQQAIRSSGANTRKVVAALPEASIFTQLITIPKVEDKKIDEVLNWEAKKYVPVPMDEVRSDRIFIGERYINNAPYLDFFFIAAPNKLIERFMKVFNFAGVEPIALETESVAITRALWLGKVGQEAGSTMILDLGANSTDMCVVQNGLLLFSQSLATGSDALTKALATQFGLEMVQAEEYKKSYGLVESQLEGKISNSLKPIMGVIVSEVKKTLDFFRSRFAQSTPNRLLLVGDAALLPGLLEYLTTQLGIETSLADPLENLKVDKSMKSRLEQISSVGHCVSVGLALKTE